MKFNLLLLLLAPALVFAQDFIPARPTYQLSFPKDHWPHSGYKTEWWYYTGFLTDDTGKDFGFQFTIFKVETKSQNTGSSVELKTLWMVHSAVSDFQSGRFYFNEQIKRQIPGMAGFNPEKALWRIENSELIINETSHRMSGSGENYSFSLSLTHSLPPVLHGVNGFSQKSPDTLNASHYYSIVDLTGSGRLILDGKTIPIQSAVAWMDHEFGSNALSEFQTGWDWTTITLSDSSRLMLFQVRGEQPFTSGTLIKPDGKPVSIDRQSIRWIPGKTWRSPSTGANYPIEWTVETNVGTCYLEAIMPNQELAMPKSGVTYWEGGVRVRIYRTGETLTGTGYLEMTGYSGSMKGML